MMKVRYIIILPLIPLTLLWAISFRVVRLKIGDYYFSKGKFDQATNWYGKVVRKEKLRIEHDKTFSLHYKEDLSKLEHALLRKREEKLLWIKRYRGFEQAPDLNIRSAMKNLLMGLDFCKIVTEGDKTYLLDWIGQRAEIEGAVRLIDGPWGDSKAIMMEGLTGPTRIFGPPSALDLNEGSLAVWARLMDPRKTYSSLVSVNKHSQIYIYHQGADGRFVSLYNDVVLGMSSKSILDDKWHHYVFTWKEREQKFYIDGQEVLSSAAPASTVETRTFYIAWVGTSDKEQWHGPIAEFLTFDRALASREVSALYALRGSTDH